MPGASDYLAQSIVNFMTGAQGFPAIASRYLALFTTAPTSDANPVAGATEVSGTGYARVQVSGVLTAAASGGPFSGSTVTLSAAVPAWVAALGTNGSGVNVYDVTGGANVGTILSVSGSVVTFTGAVSHAVANSDSLLFSAFPLASASSGSEPAVTPANATNGASINFPMAGTGGWGTVTSWGLFDTLAATSNLIDWDYLGNFKYSPFTCTSASPGVLTCTDQSFVNGQFAIVTSKPGGTLPTTVGSWAGILTVAGVSGSTFNLGVNTTGTGDGLVRQITEQAIAANTTFSFAASTLTLSAG